MEDRGTIGKERYLIAHDDNIIKDNSSIPNWHEIKKNHLKTMLKTALFFSSISGINIQETDLFHKSEKL